MTLAAHCRVQLFRMEEARPQTQRQLDIVERRITHRLSTVIAQSRPRRTVHRRGRPPETGAFHERYHTTLIWRRSPPSASTSSMHFRAASPARTW